MPNWTSFFVRILTNSSRIGRHKGINLNEVLQIKSSKGKRNGICELQVLRSPRNNYVTSLSAYPVDDTRTRRSLKRSRRPWTWQNVRPVTCRPSRKKPDWFSDPKDCFPEPGRATRLGRSSRTAFPSTSVTSLIPTTIVTTRQFEKAAVFHIFNLIFTTV